MDKINFKNLPNKTTPINAENLNKIQENVEKAINEKSSLPVGGDEGQILAKASNQDNDVEWIDNIGQGEIIQETGTASTTNVYSAKAIDNKLKTNITTGQEVATNEYIDGERVYVKRISTGSLPNATTTSVATGLNFSEIDIQKVNGMATRIKGGEKTSLPIPNNGVEVWLSGNNLNINCTINRSEFSGYVNIYYTKNT